MLIGLLYHLPLILVRAFIVLCSIFGSHTFCISRYAINRSESFTFVFFFRLFFWSLHTLPHSVHFIVCSALSFCNVDICQLSPIILPCNYHAITFSIAHLGFIVAFVAFVSLVLFVVFVLFVFFRFLFVLFLPLLRFLRRCVCLFVMYISALSAVFFAPIVAFSVSIVAFVAFIAFVAFVAFVAFDVVTLVFVFG